MIRDLVTAFFLISGTAFMLLGSFGLVRMPDLYTRIHALTKSATLGISGVLLAAMVDLFSFSIALKVCLAIAFHFLTNPVGAHMLTRSAYHHLKVEFWKNTFAKDWD